MRRPSRFPPFGLPALILALASAGISLAQRRASAPPANRLAKGDFALSYDGRGISSFSNPNDPTKAEFLSAGGRLGEPVIKYKVGEGDWLDVFTGSRTLEADEKAGRLTYVDEDKGAALHMRQTFATDGKALDWTLEVRTSMAFPAVLGDLAFVLPWHGPSGENPEAIFERSFTKHQFISGFGSFLYFVKPNGEPPYLVVTALPGTRLEYSTAGPGRAGYQAFVHSAVTGGGETRGTWRQAHTSRTLGPAGAPDAAVRVGLRFQWARSYDEMRDILFKEGLFDIRVVPGMTVPEDLSAEFSLHTRAAIESVTAEFPKDTDLVDLGQKKPGYHLYRVAFRHLGENLLTIRHDGGRTTFLEFFATEPLETLIKKRSRFITTRQQHRDPSTWYDGLFSVYDMRAKVLRGPDNTDGFDHWWGYVLACDDPALCKAPYVASKNAKFPDREEIAAVEYYLEHFVWGGLQRKDTELPYPYGIYGVPNWFECRDPVRRAGSANNNLDKMKIWRAYDYPHVVMLYYHMYEIARKYPGLTKYLDAAGYLERAFRTAQAFFAYPYEILPWYEIYKWGYYDELVILDLIAALEREGRPADAAGLRAEWEKKVKYFVYDDKYPFRSEYAIDRTAFESSYALAKYGATVEMKPDANLWQDKTSGKWYSHPVVRKEDARAFMDRQLQAGLAVRGWLETAYYLLGADFTGSSDFGSLSYMAAMGGWGILDYGVNFAARPADWLQLGYASYLSSWALMNTGRPETGYGAWFPGPENDGAAGWQFMTAKFGRAWIRKDVPRGPWNYDGEIDLGYGGALRTAATILTEDPLFGWLAYGGSLTGRPGGFDVVPRDGVRQRFYAVLPDRRLKLELDRDGFAAGKPIAADADFARFQAEIENRTGDAHATLLKVSPVGGRSYDVILDGKKIATVKPGTEADVPLKISKPTARLDIVAR